MEGIKHIFVITSHLLPGCEKHGTGRWEDTWGRLMSTCGRLSAAMMMMESQPNRTVTTQEPYVDGTDIIVIECLTVTALLSSNLNMIMKATRWTETLVKTAVSRWMQVTVNGIGPVSLAYVQQWTVTGLYDN